MVGTKNSGSKAGRGRKQGYQKKPKEHSDLALERIATLFEEADKALKKEPALSRKYVLLARKISMKYKVKLPAELKRSFCRHCNTLFRPPSTCRVRLNKERAIYLCLSCGHITRFSYARQAGSKLQSEGKSAGRAKSKSPKPNP